MALCSAEVPLLFVTWLSGGPKPPHYLLVFPLPLFFLFLFTPLHSLNIASTCLSFACPFICHLPPGPPLFISKHKLTDTLFHFRGYLSDPIPIAPSPKSLLHQRKSVPPKCRSGYHSVLVDPLK